MRHVRMFLLAVALASTALWGAAPAAQTGSLLFFVDLPPGHTAVEDGRLLLMIAKDGRRGEPRFQIGDGADAQQVFGVDVDSWTGRTSVVIDAAVRRLPARQHLRHPARHLHGAGAAAQVRDLHARRRPHREAADGSRRGPAVGAGARATSTARRSKSASIRMAPPSAIALDKVIPPIAPPTDTKYIKHERIQSELLTKFWGRPMHLGANVLLPEGFDTHPEARYPARHLPRALPVHLRRLPSRAAGSEPEARLRRALQPGRLQPHPAGARAPVLQGLDRPGLPARSS